MINCEPIQREDISFPDACDSVYNRLKYIYIKNKMLSDMYHFRLFFVTNK